MKEFSIEEKAKRYELALERCRKLYNEAKANEYNSDIEDYETIFPELAENEDEKIRKEIINCVKNYGPAIANPKLYKDMLSWLEKQGAQKPIISNNALREGIAHFGITQYQIDNWLKKYVDIENIHQVICITTCRTK